jgi:ABC-type Fe3+ transport system permease subunit
MPNLGIRLTPIPTAILAFSLNEGAFQCELVRGGLHSVSANQVLAAESLGMSRFTILRRILIPQALRAIIPPYGNEIVNLLKNTSLASVIAVSELTQRSEAIASSNFQFIPVFIAAGCMYLAMTTIVAAGQSAMERYTSMSRGPKQPRNEELITEQNKRGAGWEPVKFPGSEDRFPGIENRSYLYRIRAIYAERTEGARVQRTRA